MYKVDVQCSKTCKRFKERYQTLLLKTPCSVTRAAGREEINHKNTRHLAKRMYTGTKHMFSDCHKNAQKKRLLVSSPTKGLNSTFFRSTPDHTPLCLCTPKASRPFGYPIGKGKYWATKGNFQGPRWLWVNKQFQQQYK